MGANDWHRSLNLGLYAAGTEEIAPDTQRSDIFVRKPVLSFQCHLIQNHLRQCFSPLETLAPPPDNFGEADLFR